VGNYNVNITTNKETSKAVTCVRHERKAMFSMKIQRQNVTHHNSTYIPLTPS